MRSRVLREQARNSPSRQLSYVHPYEVSFDVGFVSVLARYIRIYAGDYLEALALEAIAQAPDSTEEVDNADIHAQIVYTNWAWT